MRTGLREQPHRKPRPAKPPTSHPHGTCLLCGGRAAYLLIFSPTDSFRRKLGFLPGEGGTLPYVLCKVHGDRMPRIMGDVEAAMEAVAVARREAN